MIRTFIGIPIPPSESIITLQHTLKKLLPNSRIAWTEPSNFHITLKFIGDTEDYYINAISLALKNVAETTETFSLETSGFGYFGSKSRPRIVWYGFKNNEMLINLHKGIEDCMLDVGFEREDREFNAHITLGRIKYLGEKVAFKQFCEETQIYKEQKILINAFVFYQSILKQEGPIYKPLETFPLQQD